jgi:hypothetical protein
MMYDLPLHGGGTGPLASPSTAVTTVINPKLHATTMRPKTGSQTAPALNARMRTSAVAAAADATPRARDEDKRSGMLWIGAGAGVVLVAALVIVMMLSNREGTGTPGNTGTTGNSAPPAASAGTAGSSGSASAGVSPPALPTELEVASQPRGASIVLNGVDTKQQTPAKVSIAGQSLPVRVVLNRQGYKPFEGEITEADVRSGKKEFTLAADMRPVRLTVSGPFEFEVVQGSQVLSRASMSHDITVQPGASVVARNRDRFVSQTLSLDFTRGQPAKITLEPLGALAVRGNAACTVVLDGQDIGEPPISNQQVGAGQHTVVFKCPGQADQTQRVQVPAGGKQVVTFTGKD